MSAATVSGGNVQDVSKEAWGMERDIQGEKEMSEFKEYLKTAMTELRPYILGEDLEKQGVSVWQGDTPEEGGMIARDPANHNDSWYVSKAYFRKSYMLKEKKK